jgi:hypothetical protein
MSLSFAGYRDIEKLRKEGRISEEDAKLAHELNATISRERIISRDADDKIMSALRALGKIKVKENL